MLKFRPGRSLTANGTLHTSSENGGPVVLTSIDDDGAGGDTEDNGAATSPAAGQWLGLTFGIGSGASTLDHTTVRYAGSTTNGSVRFSGSGATLRNCQVADGIGPGLHLGAFVSAGAHPNVLDCGIQGLAVASQPATAGNLTNLCRGRFFD